MNQDEWFLFFVAGLTGLIAPRAGFFTIMVVGIWEFYRLTTLTSP